MFKNNAYNCKDGFKIAEKKKPMITSGARGTSSIDW
jgi:hypothetical protein